MKKEEFIKNYIIDRRGTNSTKWDQLKEKYGRDDLIAMWIADTEFHDNGVRKKINLLILSL